MQSSARNRWPVRLKTESHSPALNRSGPEGGGQAEEAESDDEEREPCREEGRERRRNRGQEEAEREDREDSRCNTEPDADCKRGDLLLQLERRELELELDERACMHGDLLP